MLGPYISAKTAAVGGCLALLSGLLVASASAESAPLPGHLVAASELGRAPLPAGDADRSVAGLERSTLRLAAALDAVPVREGGPEEDRYCPAASLRVQWTAPAPSYAVGAHLDPVGPAPDARTAAVNGVVVCEGAGYAYMGFEAHWSGAAWVVTAVPSLSDEHGEHGEHAEHAEEPEAAEEHEHEEHGHVEPAVAPPAPAPAPAPAAGLPGLGTSATGAVDPYARYDPQRTCDPVAKPGTSALSAMLLRTYPASRSLGLSRTCTARGVSEHKEGRAFDWGVNVGVPAQRAAAESALSQLLATDAAGNRHALARRLGVMYLIWDRRIWSAYNPTAGWRPYSGASPHTDHVHISLSWDGAMGRTSYWQGANASLLQLDPALQLAFDGGSSGSGGSGSGGSGSGGSGSGGSGSGGSLPVAPLADAGPQAGTVPQRRGGRDRKSGGEVAPAPEHGAPAVGVVEPEPGAHAEERAQRRTARKEAKRRAREAAAAAEAELQAQAAAVEAAAAAAAAAAQAEQAAAAAAAASSGAAAPVAGRGTGKGSRKAAAPAPAAGGGGKATAPAAKGGKGAAKAKGKASAPAATGKGSGKAKAKGKGSGKAAGGRGGGKAAGAKGARKGAGGGGGEKGKKSG